MPDLYSSLGPGGLGWICLAAFLSGLVRGFAGFGTALVFLPVTSQILPPFAAILTLTFMDIVGPLPNLPRAWRDVSRRDLWRLGLGCAMLLPVGLWLLGMIAPEVFGLSVSILSLAMLAILALGLRYPGEVRGRMVTGIGAASGFLGGIAGLPGPPVILFYMSRPLPAQVIRATILLYLLVFDVMLTGYMGVFGRLDWTFVLLGLVLAIPNMLGNWLGGRMFDPTREALYRGVGYGLIAVSALSGLPIWG